MHHVDLRPEQNSGRFDSGDGVPKASYRPDLVSPEWATRCGPTKALLQDDPLASMALKASIWPMEVERPPIYSCESATKYPRGESSTAREAPSLDLRSFPALFALRRNEFGQHAISLTLGVAGRNSLIGCPRKSDLGGSCKVRMVALQREQIMQ